MALNLSFSAPDLFDVVRRLVERRFLDDPRWRGGVPPHPAPDREPRALLAERLSDLAAYLGDVDGQVEDAVRIWREMCGRPPGCIDNDDGEGSPAVSVRTRNRCLGASADEDRARSSVVGDAEAWRAMPGRPE